MFRRLAIFALILLALVAGVAYALRDTIATEMASHFVDRMIAIAATRGVNVERLDFAEAKFVGFLSIVLVEVRGSVSEERGLFTDEQEKLAFEMERVGFSVINLWRGRILVEVQDGGVAMLDTNWLPSGERVYGAQAEIEVFLNWLHLRESAIAIEAELRRLLREGRWHLAARVTGEVEFNIGEKWFDMSVRSLSDNGEMRLVLDRDDVKAVSRDITFRALTEAEIDLVAENPVLAPTIMEIAKRAFDASEVYRLRDSSFPFDAFRHVYWSWMLTREFGPEFAERVTDAHEVGSTYEFEEIDRVMDLHNNAVGRAYALAGVREEEIEHRVLTDENVIRNRNKVVLPR